jgi:hypothetical protein
MVIILWWLKEYINFPKKINFFFHDFWNIFLLAKFEKSHDFCKINNLVKFILVEVFLCCLDKREKS